MLFGSVPVGSSSGKLFVDDMTPRTIDEFLLGTARQLARSWSARALRPVPRGQPLLGGHQQQRPGRLQPAGRHPARALHPGPRRRSWRRSAAARPTSSPSSTAPTRSTTRRRSRRSGGATRPSCAGPTPGATTTATSTRTTPRPRNDANIFIGSSNIADGAGRQLWDFKDGDLRGDRPHLFKVYGFHQLPWKATRRRLRRRAVRPAVGDLELRALHGLTTTTSDTNRYAEQAGSRRTDSH